MATPPILQTDRMILRPFTTADAPRVQELAGVPEVALMTLHIPHPYPAGAAEGWIATHETLFDSGTGFVFAMVRRDGDMLMGAVSLMVEPDNGTGELGYWIGVPYWGCGYATEASAAVLDYGFGTLGLRRIFARYFRHNPASGRVMQKLGMTYEGRHRQAQRRAGLVADEECYGLLAEEWHATRQPGWTPPPNDRIRPVEASDRPWVEGLLRDEWGGGMVVSRGRIHRPANLPGFVALLSGERAGLATFSMDGRECELVTLNSLAPRLGLGRRLVESVCCAAQNGGCSRLWLVTTNDNTGALAFYQRIGFRLAALHRDAVEAARAIKPEIPRYGHSGIPMRDEIELDLRLGDPSGIRNGAG